MVVRVKKGEMMSDTVEWFSGTAPDGTVEAHVGDGVKIYPNPTRENSGGTVQSQAANALNTYTGCGAGVVTEELRIRYLTPRECFRLMDQPEDAIDRVMAVIPAKTHLYKLAGNSIVVGVLADIFQSIYIDKTFGKREKRPSLEDFL